MFKEVINTCQLPTKYFGNTNKNNINCKLTLQDQIQNDRDVSRFFTITLTCVLPILFILYAIRNISSLQTVHYILLFAIVSLSIITLCSVEGITIDNTYVINPNKKDCNSCKFNSKLSIISIGIGLGVAVIVYVIDFVISNFL